MASRAKRIRYSYVDFQNFFRQYVDEDEFDGEGKRLYLTRGKLRRKLEGVPRLQRDARAKRNELRERLEKATKALEDFETEEMKLWLDYKPMLKRKEKH